MKMATISNGKVKLEGGPSEWVKKGKKKAVFFKAGANSLTSGLFLSTGQPAESK